MVCGQRHPPLATLQCLEHASQAMSHDDLTHSNWASELLIIVTLHRILERLMQAIIVQRYTDSVRTQRFALTLRATVWTFECDNCHHVIPIEQDQPWKRPLDW